MTTLDPVNDPDFYDLVVVGRGYSASTYLFTADLSWCKKILIIGGPDAWQHIVRGDGVVNHANYIYARDHPDDKTFSPKAEVEGGNKEKLKDENAAILEKSVKWLIAQGVLVKNVPGITKTITKTPAILGSAITRPTKSTSLKQGEAVNVYSITYDDWQKPLGDQGFDVTNIKEETAQTLKVVYCGGAGPQADFYNYDRETRALRYDAKTFMDLDSFMRSDPDEVKPEVEGTSAIALLGPNAGVDAAVVALNRKFKLYWLISGPQDSDPAWLSTKHYAIGDETGQKAIDEANKSIVNYPKKIAGYPKDIRPSFTGTGNDSPRKAPYKITFPIKKENQPVEYVQIKRRGDEDIPENKLKDFSVDYVVYATGQDPNAQEVIAATDKPWRIGPAKVLGPILANEKLTPIYDVNQRFGNWFECALGLKDSDRSAYTGLEVLGASALALANFARGSKVQQAYFSHTGSYIRALDSTVQPGTKTNDALKAVQNSGWNENANTIRLYDHFDRQGEIPTVATAMGAIMPKLYSQTLIAADQLGVVKSQIEAITGFDLIASSSGTDDLISKATDLRKALEEVKKQIQALRKRKDDDNPDLTQLKAAVERYNSAKRAFKLDNAVNEKAKTYIKLLSDEDQNAIFKDGVDPDWFAFSINKAAFDVHFAILWLSWSDEDYVNKKKQDDVLKSIPQAQKWLTNLEAVFQAPITVDINSAINFNGADRTQLAVLLSALYPSIPVTNWRPITAQILEGRKVSPWGYNPDQVGKIKDWLKAMNEGEKSVNEFPSMS